MIDNLTIEQRDGQAKPQLLLRLNTGKRFMAEQVLSVDLGFYTAQGLEHHAGNDLQLFDYDRDGMLDIIIPRAGCTVCANRILPWFHKLSWALYRVDADLNYTLVTNDMGFTAPPRRLIQTDFDNDGDIDLTAWDSPIPDDSDFSTLSHYANPNNHLWRMTRVTDGLGLVTEFDYQALTDTTQVAGRPLYTQSSEAVTFPYTNVIPRRTVVKTLRVSNGFANDSFNTTRYYYQGARVHKQGWGGMGFGQLTTEQVRSGISHQVQFVQYWPYSGQMLEQRTWLTGQNPISQYLQMSSNSGFTDARADATQTTRHPLIVAYAQQQLTHWRELGQSTDMSGQYSRIERNEKGLVTTQQGQLCDGTMTVNADNTVSCPHSPWQKTTSATTHLYR